MPNTIRMSRVRLVTAATGPLLVDPRAICAVKNSAANVCTVFLQKVDSEGLFGVGPTTALVSSVPLAQVLSSIQAAQTGDAVVRFVPFPVDPGNDVGGVIYVNPERCSFANVGGGGGVGVLMDNGDVTELVAGLSLDQVSDTLLTY